MNGHYALMKTVKELCEYRSEDNLANAVVNAIKSDAKLCSMVDGQNNGKSLNPKYWNPAWDFVNELNDLGYGELDLILEYVLPGSLCRADAVLCGGKDKDPSEGVAIVFEFKGWESGSENDVEEARQQAADYASYLSNFHDRIFNYQIIVNSACYLSRFKANELCDETEGHEKFICLKGCLEEFLDHSSSTGTGKGYKRISKEPNRRTAENLLNGEFGYSYNVVDLIRIMAGSSADMSDSVDGDASSPAEDFSCMEAKCSHRQVKIDFIADNAMQLCEARQKHVILLKGFDTLLGLQILAKLIDIGMAKSVSFQAVNEKLEKIEGGHPRMSGNARMSKPDLSYAFKWQRGFSTPIGIADLADTYRSESDLAENCINLIKNSVDTKVIVLLVEADAKPDFSDLDDAVVLSL